VNAISRVGFVVALLLAVLAPAHAETTLLAPGPVSPCVATFDKTASPMTVLLGEAVTVELGLALACPADPVPLDVVIVLDRSGSMTGWPLADAKAAAISFVELVDLSTSRVAVASFSSMARVDARLSRNRRHVVSAISGLVADGGTNISSGLREAGRALFQVPARGGAARAMVLLTDGRDNLSQEAVRQQAAYQRGRGVQLITIALGLQADTALLREIATTPDDFYYAPRSRDLAAIYARVAGRLIDIQARNILVSDELADGMTYVAGSAEPAIEPEGNTLSWRIPHLPGGGLRWRYRVHPTRLGWWPVNRSAVASYVDTVGRRGQVLFPVPYVQVLSPQPVDTPEVTLTPRVTATVGASASTTPVGHARTPTPPAASPQPTTSTPLPDPPSMPTATAFRPDRPRAVFLPLAQGFSCQPDGRPVDILLVLDASTTMLQLTSTGQSKVRAAVEASRQFTAMLDPQAHHVGVVAFNDSAEVLRVPTGDMAAVRVALGKVEVAPGSRIDLGLRAALDVLVGPTRRAGSRAAVILLTDGHPVGATADDVHRAAEDLDSAGTVLYAVAIGPDANEPLLRRIASGSHRYLDAGDGAGLRRVYRDISGTLICP